MAKAPIRRTKGDGSIQELATGKYKVVFTVGTGIDGKQKRKCATVSSRKAAADKLAEFRLRYRSTDDLLKETAANITFEEYVNKWLEFKKVSVRSNTFSSYGVTIAHLKEFFGDMKMRRITVDHVNEYLVARLNSGLAASSLNIHKIVLSSIFKSALNRDIITKTPMNGAMRLPKARQKTDTALPSVEEIKKLLTTAKEVQDCTGFYSRLYPLCLLIVATGMRRGEALNLKWTSINFKTNQISIKAQVVASKADSPLKTESSRRTIYVNNKVLEVISTLPKNSDFIFCSSRNSQNPLHPDVLNRLFTRLVKSANMPDNLVLHDLRHYHATTLIKQGVNIKAISKRLGHSDISTTLRQYVHFMPEVDEEAANIIGVNYIIQEC